MNWPTFFLFVYAAFLLWLGWREFGRDQDHVSFAVAGRRSSGLTVGMSIVASSIGGSATIGMVALSYEVGFPAIWWLWSGTLGLVVLSTFLARRVRESGVLTMPDLIEHYMGKRARVIAALIIVVAWSAILAAQFSASARIVTAISPLGFGPALVLGAGVVTAYAVIGGQASVLKSDVYQYLIVIVALLAVLGWLAGTTPQVFAGLEFTLINERFGAGDIAYYMLVLGGSYVVCPMLFSRLLSARDEAAAQRAAWFGVAGIGASALVIVLIGLGVSALVGHTDAPDALLTETLRTLLPGWLGVLLLFGLFSAIISSADSRLIVASSVFCKNILQSRNIVVYRGFTALFGACALLLAFHGKSILGFLLAANDIYVSGIVAPVFVAMLSRRALHPRLAIAALVIGGSCGLIAALSDIKLFSFLGVGSSLLLALLALAKGPASTPPLGAVQEPVAACPRG